MKQKNGYTLRKFNTGPDKRYIYGLLSNANKFLIWHQYKWICPEIPWLSNHFEIDTTHAKGTL